MISTYDPFDDLDPTGDPTDLIVQDFDVRRAVFVIPVDAPLPSELSGFEVPTGSLYKRLGPLDVELEEEFAFVPLSGAELLSLERPWRAFQTAKRVFVLLEIPAARYDVLFSQAARQIGLPTVDWPAVAEALAARIRTMQRTKDKTPWADALKNDKPSRLPISSTAEETYDEVGAPPPVEDEE